MKRRNILIIGVVSLLVAGAAIGGIVYLTQGDDDDDNEPELTDPKEIVNAILDRMPIIDGHNDLPWNIRNFHLNDLNQFNFSSNLNETEPWASSTSSHTDIPRLRTGRVGAQFWVAYTSCTSQYKDSVEQTIEQVDVIKRLANAYSNDLQFATSAQDIENAIQNKKIASLIGVEGGHSIQSSFGVLRMLYELGVRYMTLTHSCNTPWADSSPVDAPNATIFAQNDGLSLFGIKIVHEMNNLGMMVDLSHVSVAAMKAGLTYSRAPVIFSHSSAFAICNHHRNVPDDVLKLVKEKNSLVMVNFYSLFIKCNEDDEENATLEDVLEHIDYIRNITGPDHVGIGADYDGVSQTPIGLEDVSKYPDLFVALWNTGRWSEEDLEKLAGRNLLRVLRDVEKARDKFLNNTPYQDTLTRTEYEEKAGNLSCITAQLTGDDLSRMKRGISDDFQEL